MKWIRNPKKQQAEEINRYIDDPNQAAGLDDETRQVLDSVRQSAEEIRPSPQFVNRLSARLQTAAQTPPSRRTRMARFVGHWTPRLAGAGLSLALVVLLFIWLSAWLPDMLPLQVELEPAANFDSVVAGQSFAFPDVPEQLPLYQVTMQPVPDTPETAMAWAASFGLPDPQVFTPLSGEAPLIVIGHDGQELTFHHGPVRMIEYRSGITMAELSGEPPSLAAAAETAVTFLAERNLLPPVYQVTDQGTQGRNNPVRLVSVDLELAGQRLDGSMPYGTSLMVGPGGEIVNATFSLLEFTALEEYVTIQPAEAVYEAFREGRATVFRTDNRYDQANYSRYYTPPLPTHDVGDNVTVTGWVHVLVAAGDQAVRATLLDPVTSAQYILVGEPVAEIAEAVTVQTSVEVTGQIVTQTGPGRWQVAVDEWQLEIVSSFVPPHCLTGTFETADGEGWLRLDEADNGRYSIQQPPDELTSGERIEICLRAEEDMAAGALNWLHIASPPYSELELTASSMSVQQVEVIREVVTEIEVGGSGTVTEHIIEVGESEAYLPQPVPTAPPVPATSGEEAIAVPILPELPYELGQSVVITGIVQGHFTADYQGQINRTDVVLLVDDQDTPLRHGLPILADEALLDELLTDHYWRFITLTGTIVGAPPNRPGSNNRAIQLESYRPAWPEVAPRNFLGHISLENFDGTQALVFTDRETAQQYILNWDIPAEAFTHMVDQAEQQQLVSGLVHPTREMAGLPFIYHIGSRSGSNIETAESADQVAVEIEAPVHRRAPDFVTWPGQAELVVERMELVYYYEPRYALSSMEMGQQPRLSDEPQIARPVWLILARSPDGLMQLHYYVEAHQR
jgi:hypothetical protein